MKISFFQNSLIVGVEKDSRKRLNRNAFHPQGEIT